MEHAGDLQMHANYLHLPGLSVLKVEVVVGLGLGRRRGKDL